MNRIPNFDYRVQDPTLQQTAFKLNCTLPTVYKMIYDGKLKSYKVRLSRRVTHESVEEVRSGK
jgi:excisionase family DNA binding protein